MAGQSRHKARLVDLPVLELRFAVQEEKECQPDPNSPRPILEDAPGVSDCPLALTLMVAVLLAAIVGHRIARRDLSTPYGLCNNHVQYWVATVRGPSVFSTVQSRGC